MSRDRCLSLPLAVSVAALSLCAVAIDYAAAAPLTARGNEPGWQIEISDSTLSFNSLGGDTFTIEPAPPAVRQGDADTYAATVKGRHFTLTIADKACVDTMSGMPYPKTANVVLGDSKLAGCAGQPADLLHGEWLVDDIGGKANVAKSKPTLAFDPDGRVHGNGSCNRFFGSFVLTGEGLTISETGASMMMCDKPLMDQERSLLKALEAVQRFEVAQAGQLRLLDKDGQGLMSLRK